MSSQSASVTVGGPAFGYTGPSDDVLVYCDTVYNSFMFAFPTEPPAASGTLTDHLGKPAAHQPVTLAIGPHKLTTFTDARGEYRFYSSLSGQGKVSVEGKDFPVPVGHGAPKSSLRLT